MDSIRTLYLEGKSLSWTWNEDHQWKKAKTDYQQKQNVTSCAILQRRLLSWCHRNSRGPQERGLGWILTFHHSCYLAVLVSRCRQRPPHFHSVSLQMGFTSTRRLCLQSVSYKALPGWWCLEGHKHKPSSGLGFVGTKVPFSHPFPEWGFIHRSHH